MSHQTCAKCARDFHCGSLANESRCWCMDLPVVPSSALQNFQGCLCPDCLRTIAEDVKSHNTEHQ